MSGKGVFLGVAVLITAIITAPGQGLIVFGNASTITGWPTPIADRNVRFGPAFNTINPAMVGANVTSNAFGYDFSSLRAQLFYTIDLNASTNSFSRVSESLGGISTFKQSTSTTPGSWFGHTATLTGVPVIGGSTPLVNMFVVVWDSQLSSDSWSDTARTGPWGMSAVFQWSSSRVPAPSEFLMVNLRSFDINIPEPSVSALAGLAGLALAFVCGRRCVNVSAKKASARGRV